MTVSCSVEFDAYADFQTFCEDASTQLNALDIFSDLANFDVVATFGNPNVNYILDWSDIVNDASFSGTFFSFNTSCTLMTDINLEVLTSYAGFDQNQHQYVAKLRKKGVERNIDYSTFRSINRVNF